MIVKGIVVAVDEIHTVSTDGCGSHSVKIVSGELKPGDTVTLEISGRKARLIQKVKIDTTKKEKPAADEKAADKK